jgi:predicted nucleic acid-binding Zn ribbon protein
MFTKRNLVDGKKTCIVCGKKFSTRTQKANGARTCSQTCSDYWHNKMRWRRAEQQGNPIKTYRKKQVKVTCKCPYCGVLHTVLMDKAPIITPRIYCKQHQWCRDEWEAQDIAAGARTTRHAGAI